MCLSKINKIDKPTTAREIGFKSFVPVRDPVSHRRDGFKFEFFGLRGRNSDRFVPRGQWIRATKKTVAMGFGVSYPSGFHAMANRNGEYNTKVLLRKVRIRGIQHDQVCLVADEMFVPTKHQDILGTHVYDKRTWEKVV